MDERYLKGGSINTAVSGYSEFARCMALIQYIIQLFHSNLFPAPVSHGVVYEM